MSLSAINEFMIASSTPAAELFIISILSCSAKIFASLFSSRADSVSYKISPLSVFITGFAKYLPISASIGYSTNLTPSSINLSAFFFVRRLPAW